MCDDVDTAALLSHERGKPNSSLCAKEHIERPWCLLLFYSSTEQQSMNT